ncbi:MAG: chromate efflux transporter [Quisquiliibacterium sp.]
MPSNDEHEMSKPPAPSLSSALAFWFKLGWISFGGPAGQIAIMHDELVERRRWISQSRFLHALNYCMVLPGPEAQQLATYLGWLMHGARGGIAAGVLFVLPSLLILGTLSWMYLRWGEQPIAAALLYTVKPAVVAIVLAAAWRIASRTITHRALLVLAVMALVAVGFLKLPFPGVILAAALIGVVLGRVFPDLAGPRATPQASSVPGSPCAIDDDDPPPAHARFHRWRTLRIALVFLAIWTFAITVLALPGLGLGPTPLQLAWFHTKAALLTFGGAYAVLPYVYQAAVEHYQWLSAAQMIDGLALGETTPGPLIMVVAFVGYLAGWFAQMTGPDSQALAGAIGATIATVFTFLPSFLFILAGGPLIEGTRHRLALQGPLLGITAAVVGVIVSLALFFAQHALFDASGDPDWFAIAIACIALAMLTRFRRGVIEVVAAAALAGLGYWLVTGL